MPPRVKMPFLDLHIRLESTSWNSGFPLDQESFLSVVSLRVQICWFCLFWGVEERSLFRLRGLVYGCSSLPSEPGKIKFRPVKQKGISKVLSIKLCLVFVCFGLYQHHFSNFGSSFGPLSSNPTKTSHAEPGPNNQTYALRFRLPPRGLPQTHAPQNQLPRRGPVDP